MYSWGFALRVARHGGVRSVIRIALPLPLRGAHRQATSRTDGNQHIHTRDLVARTDNGISRSLELVPRGRSKPDILSRDVPMLLDIPTASKVFAVSSSLSLSSRSRRIGRNELRSRRRATIEFLFTRRLKHRADHVLGLSASSSRSFIVL